MLRTLYFVLALISAAVGMLSTLIGFIWVVYKISAGGQSLEQAMHQGTFLGMIVSGVSILCWIAFAYLFVLEDERLEIEAENHP